jgi:cell division protein ZapA (FtsZ GTPase activity inhibitor)
MTTIEELLSLVEDIERAKASLLEKSIQEPLEALRDACNEAARAWSGSNIGYHATVYYHDLHPSPPSAPFSAEWGIEDNWPVHHTDPGWEMMDHREVVDMIIARAGGANPDDLDIEVAPIRERFSVIKEHAVSILSAHNATQPDDFLSKKRQEIESIKVSPPASIARGFLPQKGYTSRDSLAMHQGLRVAPHQLLIAVPRSSKSLEGAMGILENAVRLSAAHMQRVERGKQKMKTDGKTLFIGHGQ